MRARTLRGGVAAPSVRCRSRPRQSTAPHLAPALPRVSSPSSVVRPRRSSASSAPAAAPVSPSPRGSRRPFFEPGRPTATKKKNAAPLAVLRAEVSSTRPRRSPRRGSTNPTAEVQPTRPRQSPRRGSTNRPPRYQAPVRASLRAEVQPTDRRGSTNPTAPVSAPRYQAPARAEVQPTRPRRSPRRGSTNRPPRFNQPDRSGHANPPCGERSRATPDPDGNGCTHGTFAAALRPLPRVAGAVRVNRPRRTLHPPCRASRRPRPSFVRARRRAGLAPAAREPPPLFLKLPFFATKKKNSSPVSSSSPSATETAARRPSAAPSKRGAYRGIVGAFPPPFAARVRRPGPRRPAGRAPALVAVLVLRAPPAPRPARMPRPRRRRAPRAPSTATSARRPRRCAPFAAPLAPRTLYKPSTNRFDRAETAARE